MDRRVHLGANGRLDRARHRGLVHADVGATRVRLTLRAVDDCSSQQEFTDLVRARLGAPPFDAQALDTLAVDLVEEDGVVVGRLRIVDQDGATRGERTIRGQRCDEVAEALAVAAAVALEAIASAATPVPPSAEREIEHSVSPEPDPETPPALQNEDPPATIETSPLRSRVTVSAGVGLGLGPSPHGDFGIGVSLLRRRLVVSFEARYADTFTYDDVDDGIGLRVLAIRGRAAICFAPTGFEICGTGGVGLFQTEASGVVNPEPGRTVFGALGLRLASVLPLTETFALALGLELAANLNPVTVQVGGHSVWPPPPFWGKSW